MDYRSYLRQKATETGIDPFIAEALMMQESGGNPKAVSNKGAQGLMQVMSGAVADVGGGNPNDPYQNIDIGVKYLKQMYDRFGGDTSKALAAYNGGPTRLDSLGQDINKMPAETRNYVPSVLAKAEKMRASQGGQPTTALQTYADSAAQVGQPPSAQPEQPPKPPTVDTPRLLRGLEKARVAKDQPAIEELSAAVRPRLESALIKARAAEDTEAAEEIRKKRQEYGVAPSIGELGSKIYQQVEGKPFKGTPQEAEEYAKSFESWKNNIFSQAKKAIDVSGWKPEAQIAYLDLEDAYPEAVGLGERAGRAILPIVTDPSTWVGLGFGKLAVKTGQEATKAAVRKGLEKSLAKRIAQSTATKVAAEGAVYGAAQDVAGQAGRVASGGQEEVDLGQTSKVAGAGAVLGAGAGKVIDKLSGVSAVEKFARRSGSEQGARIDAEISQELGAIKTNPNFRDQPLRTEQINQVGSEAIDNAKASLNQIGAKGISEAGEDPNKLLSALSKWKKANPDSLRGTEIGDAVADAITKAQRVRSLTAEQEAAGGVRKLVRGGLEVAPIPNAVRLAGRAVLGGSQSRKQVTSDLLSNGNLKAADRILRDMGPSGLSDSASRLSLLANNSLAARAAAAAQVKAAKGVSTGVRKGPMDALLKQVRAQTEKDGEEAFASQFAPPEDLVSLATRREVPGTLGDSAPILKTIRSNAKDTDAAATQARDFQQFGTSPGNLVDNADRVNGPSQLEDASIMDLIRKASLADSAMGVPDGKTVMSNNIKNILAGGKANPAANRAAVAAEKKAQKVAAKEAESARKQQIIDDFTMGKIGEDMRIGTPSFNTLSAYVDTAPENIVTALQQYAKQNPKRAGAVIDVLTPGKKVNRQQFYTIQKDLQTQYGSKTPPKTEGALSGPSRDLDGNGNEIKAKRAYDKAGDAIQKTYDRAIDKVEKMEGLSEKSKEIVQDAIEELSVSSPRESDRVIPEVRAALAKLTAKEREQVEPTVDKLVKRFLKNKPE